jgi:voltage-gated potassium channel
MDNQKTLKNLSLILLVIIVIGTVGYMLIEDASPWKAFFTTLIILLSHWKHGVDDPFAEQLLLIFLILGSFLILAYIFRYGAEYILGGEFIERQRRKNMENKIKKMKEHYVVCGFGRVGKQVCEDLYHSKVDFVIVDRDPNEIKRAAKLGYPVVCADPTEEDSLVEAGVKRAKSLISCLGEDTHNLFVTLTARSLNPDIYIVTRANDEDNMSKIEKAGANRVAVPYQIGGYHMATMALRPAVLDFLDVIVDSRHDELEVEELEIPIDSSLIGKAISHDLARNKTGVTILAINKNDGTSKVNPKGDEIIHLGDKLIVMGNRKQLDKVTNLVK